MNIRSLKRYAYVAAWCCILMPGFSVAQGTYYTDIQRGRYLVKAGDCVACHTAENGKSFAGGYAVPTPFGTIYSTNITPDADTGIGKWSSDDFYNAMHNGVRPDGQHLYPAFPYPWYTKMTREDIDAIKKYLDTLEPVRQENKKPELIWPLTWRTAIAGWKMLFFEPGEYIADPDKSQVWNRGAYLVNGAGHCAACHSPKNIFGATSDKDHLSGGDAGESWFAPSLRDAHRDGLGAWTTDDIVQYLKTGANQQSYSAGAMTDVVMESTQYLTDDDLEAIAVYLKDMPSSSQKSQKADADTAPKIEEAVMDRGRALYVDNCMGCHMAEGAGQDNAFPPLKASSAIQAAKADTLIHVTLAGATSADTDLRPTGLAMPAFGWKLNDSEVADLINYIRNSWGNQAPRVDADAVAKVREDVRKLGAIEIGPLASPY